MVAGTPGMEVGPGWKRVIFLTFFCSRMCKAGFRSHGLLENLEQFCMNVYFLGASLVAQTVKNLPEIRRHGFDPWLVKIPWRREWLPTPVFMPGEFYGVTESYTTDTG